MTEKRKATSAKVAGREESTTILSSEATNSASKIWTLAEFCRENLVPTTFIPYIRLSQKYKDWERLRDEHLMEISEEIAIYGAKTTDETFWEIQNRYKYRPSQREQFQKAVELHRQTGFPIITTDITRYVGYRDKERLIPSPRMREIFLELYENPTLLVCTPDAEIKSERAKGHRGGGDRKAGKIKRRKIKLRSIVWKLRFDEQRSIRDIERIMKDVCERRRMQPVSRATISVWCKE